MLLDDAVRSSIMAHVSSKEQGHGSGSASRDDHRPRTVDRDRIERLVDAAGKGIAKARCRSRVRKQGEVLEGWFGGESMVAIRLEAKVVEGRLSASRLFEVLRKWRRTELAYELEMKCAIHALAAVRSDLRTAHITEWVETRKRKDPTVHGAVAVEPEKTREAA